MKKHGLKRTDCCVFRLFAVVAAALVTMTACGGSAYRQQMQENFKDNGKGEPYANEVPLNEMDFAVYDKYFPQATTLLKYNFDRKISLPCNVEYYSAKEDATPALTLEKGTEVYVLPDGEIHIPGYGTVCWPDYEEGWRYGSPFLTVDFSYLWEVYPEEAVPMYYVKTEQLEQVEQSFYESNQKSFARITKAEYVKNVVLQIDQVLYDNGAYMSEELLKK